jgi:hypothetical protein
VQYAHPPLNEAYPIVRVGYPSPEHGCAPFPAECGCPAMAEQRAPLVPECACASSVGAIQMPTFSWAQLAVGALVGVGLGYVFFATK